VAASARSNSLPRTFNREALLRHPELSMEMDRLSDTMSEIGDRLSVSARLSHRGARSPSSFSTISQDMGKRTPSTSAIYETLRRSKELRESLSRPGSRMSMDNIPDKLKEPDLHYFSDSEHHSVGGGGLVPRQELRRLRNRTLSGLDTLRLGEQARERSHSLTIGGGPGPGGGALNNLSQTPRTPCTPTFATEKDAITNFVDFNPADFIKYKIDRYSEAGDMRLSGSLHVHLLSGRGLKTAGKYKRFRDLYCVVEVDHVHKARTVVRSGGLNFDWDERFQLDLLNNMEVEFLIYSWDPQLRHRLCYRTSLRLGNLFGSGGRYHQVALRLHPAGVVYLTVRFTQLAEAYNRSTNTLQPGQLFGVSIESVVEQENSGFLVPLLVKRCTTEIEKRGLDIIGLYRLCGSETKKKMLREAFEADPEAVDLSSENVPDINVITSLLKEYLRELPEPVFSSCLYQMLVDALGVFLPNDPDGNAKLVFSILDCLPKANRNCLVHLLDHLAAVTAQAARNKMNPHNLAICFSPVLMLDTSDHLDLEAEPSIVQQLQILKYLIEIWPKSQEGL